LLGFHEPEQPLQVESEGSHNFCDVMVLAANGQNRAPGQ